MQFFALNGHTIVLVEVARSYYYEHIGEFDINNLGYISGPGQK